ncbi:MAG TPA: DNA polymerase/3'-5' exonuclease PolX [Gemmatimonadaceae bacterium]|nr:DNA polymerase/3'-5' exonuclease PolX [Gemmatimonadaceae bacterium]
MDSRTAAHILDQIGALLQLTGAPRFNARAYRTAAAAVLALGADDLGPLLHSGELKKTAGIGPATLGVIRDLVETGESSYLERLTEKTPRGLVEMARVPGLGIAKVSLLHEALGIETLDDLEEAARDGRLAKVKGFGPKTAERVLNGIAFARESGKRTLIHRGLAQALVLEEQVARHPDVIEAMIAGSIRRVTEIVSEIDIVATCSVDPVEVAKSFANGAAVKQATRDASSICIEYIDGVRMNLVCALPEDSAVALWKSTGSDGHREQVTAHATKKKLRIDGLKLLGPRRSAIGVSSEAEFYSKLGLQEIPPELREGMGEVEAAASHDLPDLVESEDIKGALHCHTTWSDGGASIAEMALAAQALGWSYIGISDHSQFAFYAGGMKRDKILRQHEEIDELNSRMTKFRILKGCECDILPSGNLDYEDDTLDLFDYIVGSVHSQFKMAGEVMTARVLRAMDDPRLTILGHATGRLLLSRQGYQLDIDAVIEKAVETATAIELNADPYRLDLDWRHCRTARDKGVLIAIGPDAHSEDSLENVEMGVALARKAWCEKKDVLNTRTWKQVLSFARSKKLRA